MSGLFVNMKLKISISKRLILRGDAHKWFNPKEILGFDQLSMIMSSCVWSPVVWHAGCRDKKNFLSCEVLGLDFDDGAWTLDDAKTWVTDLNLSAIIGTTKSHQKEKTTAAGKVSPACDRFRIVVPFAEKCTDIDLYEANMRVLLREIPADVSCSDGARFFYPCREITWVNRGGEGYVLDESLKQREIESRQEWAKAVISCRETGLLPSWILSAVNFGVVEGGRHTMCYRIGANLSLMGYSVPEIISLIAQGPLAVIGRQDIERAVSNGAKASSSFPIDDPEAIDHWDGEQF